MWKSPIRSRRNRGCAVSNYHILEVNRKQDDARVVFHIDVPADTNFAGMTYRAALVEWLGGAPVESAIPGLDTAAHGLDDGSIYEHVEVVDFPADETNANKQAIIEATYISRQAAILARIQAQLEFWSFNADVA